MDQAARNTRTFLRFEACKDAYLSETFRSSILPLSPESGTWISVKIRHSTGESPHLTHQLFPWWFNGQMTDPTEIKNRKNLTEQFFPIHHFGSAPLPQTLWFGHLVKCTGRWIESGSICHDLCESISLARLTRHSIGESSTSYRCHSAAGEVYQSHLLLVSFCKGRGHGHRR